MIFNNNHLIEVQAGNYQLSRGNTSVTIHTSGYRISRFLVTNSMYLIFLNSSRIPNEEHGTWKWVNTDHINTKIVRSNEYFYQEQGGKHILHSPIISSSAYAVVPGFENHPVVCVNWTGAQKFAEYLGARLPSEAEWEIAATSGNSDNIFSWGAFTPDKTYANYGENYCGTTPIGQFPPNDFGGYDFSGNVREWCNDWSSYSNSMVSSYEKIIKGGGWNKPEFHLKCCHHNSKWFRLGGASIGLRIVFN